MDIFEALDKLSGFFDTLYGTGFLSKDEENMVNEVEYTISNYIYQKEDKSGS